MSRPVCRRVAFFGYLGSDNLGGDATFETVLAWLRSTQPDVQVRSVTIEPDEVTARYGVLAVPLAWLSSRTGGNRVTEASRKRPWHRLHVDDEIDA
jgi:polysaccharide pyruvyl transferase WcaK-like protein